LWVHREFRSYARSLRPTKPRAASL
jgi:hypothetical protein